MIESRPCAQCGTPYIPKINASRSKFCSPLCRFQHRYHALNPGRVRKRVGVVKFPLATTIAARRKAAQFELLKPRPCFHCSKMYLLKPGSGPNSRFCSRNCRQRASRNLATGSPIPISPRCRWSKRNPLKPTSDRVE